MSGHSNLLRGRSVLIAEDEPLIALDLEQMLMDLGAEKVSIAMSVPDGVAQVVASAQPNFGVLDVLLGKENAIALADILAARGAPFIFATGYSDAKLLEKSHPNAPIVEKPIDPIDLARKIALTLGPQ